MARKSNPRLKGANDIVEVTPHQIQEFKRCAEDVVYFCENYVKIQHPVKGSVPFKLYQYQKKMLQMYQDNKYVVVLSARQSGKSITSAMYLLWYASFHFEKTILIASNKNAGAMEMIHRIRFAYEELPRWLKPGVNDASFNKHELAFDNGSRILSTATSEDSGRGLSISCVAGDSLITVRNKDTGEVEVITFDELRLRLSNE